jgi:hypothetical protein
VAESLPTVGGNDGSWGTVLNRFLEISHNADGSLNTAATIGTYDPSLPEGGNANPNLASGSKPGFVQLAGDLAGTYSSPALASIITAGSVGSATAIPIITYDAKGRITTVSTAAVNTSTQRTFAYFAG